MQEIYNIIKEELTKKFGDETKANSFLEKIGKVVVMDILMNIMDVANKDQQNALEPILQEGETGKFLEKAKVLGLPVEKIYEKIVKKVIEEVFI